MTKKEALTFIKEVICKSNKIDINQLNQATEKQVWEDVLEQMNITVFEQINSYKTQVTKAELQKHQIDTYCVSSHYKTELKKSEKHELKGCQLKKISPIVNLFTKPDSLQMHSTTKDFFAIYCETYGWNHLLTMKTEESKEEETDNTEEDTAPEIPPKPNPSPSDGKPIKSVNYKTIAILFIVIAIISMIIYAMLPKSKSTPKQPDIANKPNDSLTPEKPNSTNSAPKKTLKISDLKDKQKPALITVNDTISEQEANTEDDIDKTIKRLYDSFMDTVLIKDNYKVVIRHGEGERLLDEKDNVIKQLKGAYAINSNLIVTTQNDGIYGDKYGAINHKGETVIPFKYSRYNKLNNSLIIFSLSEIGNVDVHKEDQDLYESDGELLFKNCYAEQFSEFKDDVLPIAKGDKFGLLNKQGKLIVPFKYQSIEAIKYGFIVVGKGSYKRRKYGVINTKGVAIIPMDYKDVTVKSNNLFEVSKKNKRYTVNTSNTCVKDCN